MSATFPPVIFEPTPQAQVCAYCGMVVRAGRHPAVEIICEECAERLFPKPEGLPER